MNLENNKKYLYKDLSWKIVRLCFDVQNEYGNGHNERIYHAALKEKFDLNGIKNISKSKIKAYSKTTGKEIGYYEPDFLVDNVIILELKARPMNFKKDEIQLLEYLRTTIYEVGYLVNFCTPSLYHKRIIYTNDRKNFINLVK